MTRELYEELSALDDLLMKINGGVDHFLHTMAGDRLIEKAYLELFGKPIPRAEFNCPRCVFRNYKAVAIEYAQYKNNLESQKPEPTEENTTVEAETVTKKKRNGKRRKDNET